MIAEPAAIVFQANPPREAPSDASSTTLSLSGVVAMLQVLLAARRAARTAPHLSGPCITRAT